jgi:kynureninase
VEWKPLRAKSIKLTGYLEFLLTEIGSKRFTVITPQDPERAAVRLSILAHEHPKKLHNELNRRHVKCDFREPNVIRVAPPRSTTRFTKSGLLADLLTSTNDCRSVRYG